MINLDYECMKYSQEFPVGKDSAKIYRKCLGILHEDGMYAMFLWIRNKDEEIEKAILKFLNEENIKSLFLENEKKFNEENLFDNLKEISKNLRKLFLTKKLLDKLLTYALYHAKTRGDMND